MDNKTKVPTEYPLFPMPVCLLGANVNRKPNFCTIAWFNMIDSKPYMIGVSSSRGHYTNKGIHENRTFSVNIPSLEMVVVTDYCGLHSGATVDKSGIFETFYGELGTAPMIQECPMNIECRLVKWMELTHHEFIVGEVAGAYADKDCVANGRPDIHKINPLVYDELNRYWKLGEEVEKAFSIGRTYNLKSIRK
jgi:flavin reductase (DIM6/NTAB) family NADH-FMN oxidoreductase RutF